VPLVHAVPRVFAVPPVEAQRVLPVRLAQLVTPDLLVQLVQRVRAQLVPLVQPVRPVQLEQ